MLTIRLQATARLRLCSIPNASRAPCLSRGVSATMDGSSESIATRGRIVLGVCFAAAAVPLLLSVCGVVDYDWWRSGDDPLRPADLSLAYRVCLVIEWLVPAFFLCWAAAEFRVRYSVLFEAHGYGIVAVAAGAIGATLLVSSLSRWSAQPYTHLHYQALEGWHYGLSWLLLSWSFVFGWRHRMRHEKMA